MSEWQFIRFADFCTLKKGKKPDLFDERPMNGQPYLTARYMRGTETPQFVNMDDRNAVFVQPNEIIIICDGSNSGETFTGFKGALSSTMATVSHSNVISTEFLRYFLISQIDKYAETKTGAAIPHLDLKGLKESAVPVPSLTEQARIVAILDEAFDGIARANANAEANFSNARELPDALLDTVLADHAQMWVQTTLGAIADFKNGLNFTKTSKGEAIRIVGVKDFQNEYWVPEQGLDMVIIDGKLPSSYELKSGDILTVRSNGNKKLIGRCMIAADVPEKTSHSGFTIRIRVTDSRVMPEFLAYVLKSRRARAALVASGGGTNISSLNQQALSELPIAFPSMEEQVRILARIESLMGSAMQLAESCRLKLASLAALKQSLLHKALSGQLTTKEIIAA